MATTIFVLTARGTRAEADEAREIFGGEGRAIAIGLAAGHTPGQALNGDVVVIGDGAPTAEQDASGKVERYDSLSAARRALKGVRTRTLAVEAEAAAGPGIVPEAIEAAPDQAVEPEDELAGKSRVELIQHAAQRWPGARRWATLSNVELVAAIHELEAGD